MKTQIKNLFTRHGATSCAARVLPALIAVLNLTPAGRLTAQTFTTLHSFTGSDGANPRTGLILAGNTLYGTAEGGGDSGRGTLFAFNADGTGFTNLYSFTATAGSGGDYGTNSDGAGPSADLISNASANTLYGTAFGGGSSGYGTVFAVSTNGTGFTNLHSFTATSGSVGYYGTNSEGAIPNGLILSNNILYGTASHGGGSGYGTVFAVNTDGTGFTNLHNFTAIIFDPISSNSTNSDGAFPNGLVLSGNTLYGTAYAGGTLGYGTVFAVNTDGTGFTNLHNFTIADGGYPYAGLILAGNTLYGTAQVGGGGGMVFALGIDGTGFTNLHGFTGFDDGGHPKGRLLLSAGTLYGTTFDGGILRQGAMFAVNTDGTGFTRLHSFTYDDGANPYPGLILSGNNLYGTTYRGGASGNGTVFSLSLNFVMFTANPAAGGDPLTVQFNCPSIDRQGNVITQWNWNFGDGTNSTVQNPTHTYTTAGTFNPALIATNNLGVTLVGSGPSISVAFNSKLITNGGFETGDFTGWTLSGDNTYTYLDNGSVFPPHSGSYEVALGNTASLGYLSQTIATTAGTTYLLSCWLDNSYADPDNVFNISWNGTSLLAVTNPVASGWANYQFLVTATGPSTILQFGYADIGANYLGLDDVSLVATQPPVVYLQGQWLNQQLVLSWTNTGFGLQSAPAITGPFTNLPAATSPYTNPIAGPQQFFRLSQ